MVACPFLSTSSQLIQSTQYHKSRISVVNKKYVNRKKKEKDEPVYKRICLSRGFDFGKLHWAHR